MGCMPLKNPPNLEVCIRLCYAAELSIVVFPLYIVVTGTLLEPPALIDDNIYWHNIFRIVMS